MNSEKKEKPRMLAATEEVDKIFRSMLVWANTFPEKPVDIIKYEFLSADQGDETGMALSMLIVHLYAGTAGTAVFAERYSSCSILPSGLGGEGGGTIGMPIDVTYGGTRTVGTASISDGTVKFTPGTVEV